MELLDPDIGRAISFSHIVPDVSVATGSIGYNEVLVSPPANEQ